MSSNPVFFGVTLGGPAADKLVNEDCTPALDSKGLGASFESCTTLVLVGSFWACLIE